MPHQASVYEKIVSDVLAGRAPVYKDYAAGERDSKPTDMTELEITGKWQNVILVITDMNKVVYFNTAEDLAEYQQNHDADLVLYSTKAPNGSALPTTDAPTP